MSEALQTLKAFEAGELPLVIHFLYDRDQVEEDSPLNTVISPVAPVESLATGSLSIFLFASEQDGEEWLIDHPSFFEYGIMSSRVGIFWTGIDHLAVYDGVFTESLSLWIKCPDGWEEHCKPLNELE